MIEAVKASGAPRPKKKATETDQQYWDRILRDAYSDHVATLMQEQEAIAKTLGKDNRVRKRINYTEKDYGKIVAAEVSFKNSILNDLIDLIFTSEKRWKCFRLRTIVSW